MSSITLELTALDANNASAAIMAHARNLDSITRDFPPVLRAAAQETIKSLLSTCDKLDKAVLGCIHIKE